MTRPATDVAAAREWLEWWQPGGPWILTAVEPDQKGIDTRTFAAADVAALEEWILRHGAGRNIYFHVNPTMEAMSKKAAKTDVLAMRWLHVDIDQLDGETLEETLSRGDRLLADFRPAPSAVVFSGGGYQGFWRLEQPVEVRGDLQKIAEAERYNHQLEIVFQGDHCRNLDRIMRLPGTVNRPNAKKRRKGRVEDLARVVRKTGVRYPLAAFVPAPRVQTDRGAVGGDGPRIGGEVRRLSSVDELPEAVPDRVRVLIVNGFDPDDPDKYGGDRSRAVWAVLCGMAKAGVADEVMYAVVTDPDFGISAHILDQGRPHEYALRQIRAAKDHAVHPRLQELNERHAVVGDLGGRCRVISEIYDHGLNRWRISKQGFEDFKNRYRRIKIVPDGADKPVGLGSWWLDHAGCRYYDTMSFLPGREAPPNVLNLWRGFAVEAAPGKCDLFLKHVLDNVCSGDEGHFRYLERWMARMVQKPDEAGQVAVVLRGMRGSGKGFFFRKLGRLLGRHFLHVSDSKHLTGSFNWHLRDAILVFADEAFYAGDKRHESVLKTLITEDTIFIEPKGVDAEAAPNFIHLGMSSNSDWVVPAGPMERRFLVLDVRTASADQTERARYFDAVDAQLEDGGYEALLYHLLHLDISGFNVRDVPRTKALQAQAVYSLAPEEEWWFNKLRQGHVLASDGDWPEQVFCEVLAADFVSYTRGFGYTRRGNATRLGQFLRKMMPGLRVRMTRSSINVEMDGRTHKIDRPRAYVVPDLATCRAVWDEKFEPFEWPEIAEVNGVPEPF